MQTEQLDYPLPEDLIAQKPADRRPQSRLLVLERRGGGLADRAFADLADYLRAGDCLVLNDTRVLPARFFACKETGAVVEGLFLEQTNQQAWKALLKNARRIRPGDWLTLLDRKGQKCGRLCAAEKLDQGQWLLMPQQAQPALTILQQVGLAPLPPYIRRPRTSESPEEDLSRYQTIYACRDGAVAAPTAGLHFDRPLLETLCNRDIRIAYLTLHVGIGTFRPIQTDTLEKHIMHSERYQISPQAAETINAAAAEGGRIVAVGTTSVRTLETVAEGRKVKAADGQTNLFIQPGYTFQIVDAMVTNFHLPRSTLLALVAAFAGLDQILNAYRHAIEKKYRFYSYGDAMLIF